MRTAAIGYSASGSDSQVVCLVPRGTVYTCVHLRMYSRSLEIYLRGPYSLYLQGTWNKEREMWLHNNSPTKDATRITDSRLWTSVHYLESSLYHVFNK